MRKCVKCKGTKDLLRYVGMALEVPDIYVCLHCRNYDARIAEQRTLLNEFIMAYKHTTICGKRPIRKIVLAPGGEQFSLRWYINGGDRAMNAGKVLIEATLEINMVGQNLDLPTFRFNANLYLYGLLVDRISKRWDTTNHKAIVQNLNKLIKPGVKRWQKTNEIIKDTMILLRPLVKKLPTSNAVRLTTHTLFRFIMGELR
jgi:hypothetical protein